MEDKKKYKKAKESPKNIRVISTLGVLLSLIGIADTTWLTITHYSTTLTLACPSTGIINCAKVTSSSYSEIFGIPVALLGLLFFLGMVILQLPMFWRSANKLIRYARLSYSSVGLVMVFWLVYVEFHKLNAICLYCTLVHVLTFSLFVVTTIGTTTIIPDSTTD
jgi:uncharacterized membrane protein